LKGLGGSFGYAQITKIAKLIHDTARQHSEVEMDTMLHDLNRELEVIQNESMNNRKAI